MIIFEAISDAQARLGGTLGTIIAGISSYSSSAAYTAFLLASSSRFCGGNAIGKVLLVKSTHIIRANASWGGTLLVNEGSDDIFNILEVGDLLVLSCFLVADKLKRAM